MVANYEDVFSLHRYFIWANRMRTHFDEILSSGRNETEQGLIESVLYMSYWYGGLYVVIEGWKTLSLADARIDNLLNSENVDLLRLYRNGTFHYQREYASNKFTKIMEDGVDVATWVRDLNEQFGRYFLEWSKSHSVGAA